MKNILVTGGLGFIGHHLINKLLEQENLQITILDIKSNETATDIFNISNESLTSNSENVKKFHINSNNLTIITQDIRNKKEVFEIFEKENFDTCIHLAAKVSVIESIANPEETFTTNEYGTLNILEGCARTKVPTFVFASSAAVYGEPKILPIREDHLFEPLSPYGASKVSGEALLSSFVNTGKIEKGVALRFFNVFGEGQNPQYAGVITKFAERLLNNMPPLIFGDGMQTRDFVYVGDIVKAIILAAESLAITRGYHSFNVATGNSISVIELATIMNRIFEKKMDPVFEDERKGEIKDGSADISKIVKLLEFKPSTNLENGLKIFKTYFEKKLVLSVN